MKFQKPALPRLEFCWCDITFEERKITLCRQNTIAIVSSCQLKPNPKEVVPQFALLQVEQIVPSADTWLRYFVQPYKSYTFLKLSSTSKIKLKNYTSIEQPLVVRDHLIL